MWFVFSPVFLPPSSVVLLDFFNRVFGRFVTRGVQQRDRKQIAENFPQPPKKIVSYSLSFVLFTAPLEQ
jgi:hypothetical protein